MAIRRLGSILVDLGYLTDEQLEMVLEEQSQRPGALLGKVAMEMGVISEEQLVQGVAEQMGMQIIELADRPLPEELRNKVSEAMAQLYRVVPVAFDDDTLTERRVPHGVAGRERRLVGARSELARGGRSAAESKSDR